MGNMKAFVAIVALAVCGCAQHAPPAPPPFDLQKYMTAAPQWEAAARIGIYWAVENDEQLPRGDFAIVLSYNRQVLVTVDPNGKVTLHGDPNGALFWAKVAKELTTVQDFAERTRRQRCDNPQMQVSYP